MAGLRITDDQGRKIKGVVTFEYAGCRVTANTLGRKEEVQVILPTGKVMQANDTEDAIRICVRWSEL